MTSKLSIEKTLEASPAQTNDVMIRLSAEESIKLVEAILDPARGPNPRLIAAAHRYLAGIKSD
jgi:hypothetical protein